MEVRTDSKNGKCVLSATDTIKAFQGKTEAQKDQWAQELRDDPDRFSEIEQEIDQHYRRGAGELVAGIVAEVTNTPQMENDAERVRQRATIRLRAPEPRTIKVRLLCGLILWVTTLYCAPRRGKSVDATQQAVGLYPELAALGIGKGCRGGPAIQGRSSGRSEGVDRGGA